MDNIKGIVIEVKTLILLPKILQKQHIKLCCKVLLISSLFNGSNKEMRALCLTRYNSYSLITLTKQVL